MKNFAEVNFLDIDENSEYITLAQRVINQAFQEEKIDKLNLYVNIVLTTPNSIKKINKQYRHIDEQTDVLSFPMFEKQEIEEMLKNGNQIKNVLGDIVISISRVKEQAIEYGHSFERELAYMLIHGFYHLMGYDHIEEEDKKLMRIQEEKVLEQLNIAR